MKSKILALSLVSLCSFSIYAQVDNSTLKPFCEIQANKLKESYLATVKRDEQAIENLKIRKARAQEAIDIISNQLTDNLKQDLLNYLVDYKNLTAGLSDKDYELKSIISSELLKRNDLDKTLNAIVMNLEAPHLVYISKIGPQEDANVMGMVFSKFIYGGNAEMKIRLLINFKSVWDANPEETIVIQTEIVNETLVFKFIDKDLKKYEEAAQVNSAQEAEFVKAGLSPACLEILYPRAHAEVVTEEVKAPEVSSEARNEEVPAPEEVKKEKNIFKRIFGKKNKEQ